MKQRAIGICASAVIQSGIHPDRPPSWIPACAEMKIKGLFNRENLVPNGGFRMKTI
jgi:hypothetical protein